MNTQSQMHLNRQKVSDALIALEGSASHSGKAPLRSVKKNRFSPGQLISACTLQRSEKGKCLECLLPGYPWYQSGPETKCFNRLNSDAPLGKHCFIAGWRMESLSSVDIFPGHLNEQGDAWCPIFRKNPTTTTRIQEFYPS